MLLPGVILIFIFAYIPLYGVIIAFEDYSGTRICLSLGRDETFPVHL